IMPGMDGGKIFTAIQEIRPDLPVLLSSGYALDGQAEVILQKGCRGFIQKPFNLTELSEHVRKVLDRG
ncbi:MAG: response regulator, partial [Desulfobacterales bacterium]